MGLADWFQEFCRSIQVRNESTRSDRYKAITKRLNTDFWNTTSDTAHSFYTGSFGRNTAVHGTSDVDVLHELPAAVYHQYNGYTGNGQSALLQAVRSSIKKTYSTTDVGADGQVVVVPFGDGMSFEIVPAFANDAGSLTFPNSNGGGSWKTTNPKPEIDAMHIRNVACNGNLVPLCRMMREWKRQWTVPISGLLIDTLAYQFIADWAHRDKSYLYYDFMCRDFFTYMAEQESSQEWWRAPGSGQYVWGGKDQFQYKAKRCHNLSLEAIRHETATPKEEWSARYKWREIFGSDFPS